MPQKPPAPPTPPPPSDDDDKARRRASGSIERLSVPGYPTARLPSRPRAKSSPDLLPPSEIESTPPSPAVQGPLRAPPRAREKTLVGGFRQPPVSATEPSEPPEPASKGSLHPAPWDDTTDAQIAAERLGYRVVRTRPTDAPSASEIERLEAKVEELQGALRRAERGGTSVELKLRGLNIVAIITALGGLGLGVNATYRQTKAPPEAVATQGVRLADTERETKEARDWRLARDKYERDRAAVQLCRDRQLSAALYRLGYRLPSLPHGDDVHWLSEYKEDPHQLRRQPQYRPEDDCPDMPAAP